MTAYCHDWLLFRDGGLRCRHQVKFLNWCLMGSLLLTFLRLLLFAALVFRFG